MPGESFSLKGMYDVGSKFETKKVIGEIISIFPPGQAGATEASYVLMMNGAKIKIKEADVNLLFEQINIKTNRKESTIKSEPKKGEDNGES